MKRVNLALVGATGLVGTTILEVLEERNFPFENLILFASKNSAGQKIIVGDKEYVVEELREDSFNDRDIDIALFAAGGGISEKYAPIAAENGIVVIDNSSFWRMEEDISLIVPEVNKEDINLERRIIANPNCSTIQSVIPLKAISDNFKIKRIVFSTYQAVSGAGIEAIKDLEEDKNDKFPYHIKRNTIPQIDDFLDNGYTKEEMKMIDETNKILRDDIRITSTTVRVPIKNSHAVNMNIELEDEFELEEIYEALENQEGIVIVDDLENLDYPLQEFANGKDEVFVGRIRRDFSIDNGINLWCVADNIRKGAATNAVQIAEIVKDLI